MGIVLITGASSGIGRAFAELLPSYLGRRLGRSRGLDAAMRRFQPEEFWLLGRREGPLRELAGALGAYGSCRVFILDLADTEQLEGLLAEMEATDQDFDLVFNGAGLGRSGPFADLPPETVPEQLDVNVCALSRICHTALRRLRPGGRLLNVASVTAFLPMPQMAVYAASKAYVRALSLALAQEAKTRDIRVSCILPGTVRTPFFETAFRYRKLRDYRRSPFAAEPSAVARAAWMSALRGRREIVYPWPFALLRFPCRCLPDTFLAWAWARFCV